MFRHEELLRLRGLFCSTGNTVKLHHDESVSHTHSVAPGGDKRSEPAVGLLKESGVLTKCRYVAIMEYRNNIVRGSLFNGSAGFAIVRLMYKHRLANRFTSFLRNRCKLCCGTKCPSLKKKRKKKERKLSVVHLDTLHKQTAKQILICPGLNLCVSALFCVVYTVC